MDSATIKGRIRKPLSKKLNPIWWLFNDDEQKLPGWYAPKSTTWARWFYWNVFRNPLQNFRCYIIGVQDRNYTIIGRFPVLTVQRNDLIPPNHGFQWCILYKGDLWLPRPFISYSGRYLVWYIGTQPTGIFGIKFNLHRE